MDGMLGRIFASLTSTASPPVAQYYAGNVDAGALFLLVCVCMFFYIGYKPPGIAYTYCWLLSCLIATVATHDAKALAACAGVCLNFSWYASQIIYKDLWSCLLPYWRQFLPQRYIAPCIRFGDIMIHPFPLMFFLPYCRFVDLRIAIYSICLERWYFLLTERQLIGNGSVCNIIYDCQPPMHASIFITSQLLSAVMALMLAVYNIRNCYLRFMLLGVCLLCLASLALVRTDRLEILRFPARHANWNQCKSQKDGKIVDEQKGEKSTGLEKCDFDESQLISWHWNWVTGGRHPGVVRSNISLALDDLIERMQTSTDHVLKADRVSNAIQTLTSNLSLSWQMKIVDSEERHNYFCSPHPKTLPENFSANSRRSPLRRRLRYRSGEHQRTQPASSSSLKRGNSPRDINAAAAAAAAGLQKHSPPHSASLRGKEEDAVLWEGVTSAFSALVRMKQQQLSLDAAPTNGGALSASVNIGDASDDRSSSVQRCSTNELSAANLSNPNPPASSIAPLVASSPSSVVVSRVSSSES